MNHHLDLESMISTDVKLPKGFLIKYKTWWKLYIQTNCLINKSPFVYIYIYIYINQVTVETSREITGKKEKEEGRKEKKRTGDWERKEIEKKERGNVEKEKKEAKRRRNKITFS